MRNFGRWIAWIVVAGTTGVAVPWVARAEDAPTPVARDDARWREIEDLVGAAAEQRAASQLWARRAETARTEAWARHALEKSGVAWNAAVRFDERIRSLWNPTGEANVALLAFAAARTNWAERSLYATPEWEAFLASAPTEKAAAYALQRMTDGERGRAEPPGADSALAAARAAFLAGR